MTEKAPEFDDAGVPHQSWEVRDFTAEELEALKPPLMVPYFTQADIWDRVTEEEGEQFYNAVQGLSYKLRGQWNTKDRVLILTEDPNAELAGTPKDRSLLYVAIHSFCLDIFGEERTAELLEPTGEVMESEA